MAARRSSKVYSEIPEDSLFNGQAPPGSQKRDLPRNSSTGSLVGDPRRAFRGEETNYQKNDIAVYKETVKPVYRRKSKASISTDPSSSSEDLSGQPADAMEEAESNKGMKGRRKSKASLSITTSETVADFTDAAPRPGSTKVGGPITPKVGGPVTPKAGGPVTPKAGPTMINDTKRASSRLLIDKQKASNKNMALADPEEDRNDRRNTIDCDTCCIFIF